MPFCEHLGAGAPASDPSPKKSGPSSALVNCAASLIVKGRTRTVTEMLEDPSLAVVIAPDMLSFLCPDLHRRNDLVENVGYG